MLSVAIPAPAAANRHLEARPKTTSRIPIREASALSSSRCSVRAIPRPRMDNVVAVVDVVEAVDVEVVDEDGVDGVEHPVTALPLLLPVVIATVVGNSVHARYTSPTPLFSVDRVVNNRNYDRLG